MESPSDPLWPRRQWLKAVGLGGIGLSSGLLAEVKTPPQTEGPFYPTKALGDKDGDLTRVAGREGEAQGDKVFVVVSVVDEKGAKISGAVVDVWQASASGRYDHPRDPNPAPLDPNFQGFARFLTDNEGECRFTTIIPGIYPAGENWDRPPHIHFRVDPWSGKRLTTQMYFAGQALNVVDDILLDTRRRHGEAAEKSLIVDFGQEKTPEGLPLGRFKIVLGRTPEAE